MMLREPKIHLESEWYTTAISWELQRPRSFRRRTLIALINAEWSDGRLGDPQALFSGLKANARPLELKEFGRYPALLKEGSLGFGMEAAQHKLAATYRIPYISHVPLEAGAAVAQWQGDQVTVHSGTQAPFVVRAEIAKRI